MRSFETLKRETLERALALGESNPSTPHGATKTESVTLRVLEPFTNIQLLVWIRSNTYDTVTGEYRPVSCRIRGKKQSYERVTVLGIVMPDRIDLTATPILRTIDPSKYYDLIELSEARETLRAYASEMQYVAAHGSLEQIQYLNSALRAITQ